jgi:RNA 2',3'-cyclic 3'-phosphodiesterase
VRLFVALIPPDDVLAHLAAAVAGAVGPLADEGASLRWGGQEQWHLTLAFLGQVEDGALVELMRRFERVARRHQPMELGVSGAGVFGSRTRARVLWAGIRGDRPGLRALAASVTASARRCGLRLDDRPYRPHLTLARSRLRQGSDVSAFVEAFESYIGPVWTARELHLVRSYLGRQGARYETLRSWPLGKPRRAD